MACANVRFRFRIQGIFEIDGGRFGTHSCRRSSRFWPVVSCSITVASSRWTRDGSGGPHLGPQPFERLPRILGELTKGRGYGPGSCHTRPVVGRRGRRARPQVDLLGAWGRRHERRWPRAPLGRRERHRQHVIGRRQREPAGLRVRRGRCVERDIAQVAVAVADQRAERVEPPDLLSIRNRSDSSKQKLKGT